MKKSLLIILTIAALSAQAQTKVVRTSINEQGGTAQANNFYVSWSIGEPVIDTTQSGNLTLTQSFQQPFKRSIVANLNSTAVFTTNGQRNFDMIKLSWYENTAQAGEIFNVEKVNTKGDFELIDIVSAKSGNSLRDYTLIDKTPLPGENIYRITLSKNDGTETQSEIIRVEFKNTKTTIQIFPNPTDGFFDVFLKTDISEESTLYIYNSMGQKLRKEITIGESVVHFDLSDLPVGLYTVRISQKNRFDTTEKIILQR